jgi:hypothetical protein
MPIKHSVDHRHRLVIARGVGILTGQDIFGYQRSVWSNPDLVGYNELMDMTHVEHIALESIGRVEQLASVSASMDTPTVLAKFAIVAPDDIAFGLGRMYQTYRSLDERSTKEVGVFRTWKDALVFVGCTAEPSDLALS